MTYGGPGQRGAISVPLPKLVLKEGSAVHTVHTFLVWVHTFSGVVHPTLIMHFNFPPIFHFSPTTGCFFLNPDIFRQTPSKP